MEHHEPISSYKVGDWIEVTTSEHDTDLIGYVGNKYVIVGFTDDGHFALVDMPDWSSTYPQYLSCTEIKRCINPNIEPLSDNEQQEVLGTLHRISQL